MAAGGTKIDKATRFSTLAKVVLEDAGDARRGREFRLALALERRALYFWERAAGCLSSAFDQEPARSNLYLQAARLALDLGKASDAVKHAGAGLAGGPGPIVRSQLRSVLEEAKSFCGILASYTVPGDPE